MGEKLTIRPYARLLTMLGEQLIKNGRIALVELIKNSYDADASFVRIVFGDFNDDFSAREDSFIIIEDDGTGMNERILKESWMNPATPEKLKIKKINQRTEKGRILQGEKGIGRFAIFKLGRKIEIVTRSQKKDPDTGKYINEVEKEEHILKYDFRNYDDDFLSENGTEKDLFLDQLTVDYENRQPEEIVKKQITLGADTITRAEHGTKIIISGLNTTWNREIIDCVYDDTERLQPLFHNAVQDDFQIVLYKNEDVIISKAGSQEDLLRLLTEKSVFIVNGQYYENDQRIELDIDNHTKELHYTLDFNGPELRGITQFNKYFGSLKRQTECGSFSFRFYIFDLDTRTKSYTQYVLDEKEKRIVKEHRIYLYRDGIRVMPYGDPEDDWLRIDSLRGVESAASLFSNDQVVGFVNITQEGNPRLRDKTNREGLIEEGNSLEDFINVIQVVLRYLRMYPYKMYLLEKKKKQEYDFERKGKPQEIIKTAKEKNRQNQEISKLIEQFEKSYNTEQRIFKEKIQRTENLAAIGLSVHTASHDTIKLLDNTADNCHGLTRSIQNSKNEVIDKKYILSELVPIDENLDLIRRQMNDIQRLFPSTKTRKTSVDVIVTIQKIHKLYEKALVKNEIQYEFVSDGIPLYVQATDAVLMQVFINLFDNSLYWLKTVQSQRKIKVVLASGDSSHSESENSSQSESNQKSHYN